MPPAEPEEDVVVQRIVPATRFGRSFIALAGVILLSASAWAQDPKPAPLADYVSLCLALWEGGPDIQPKASALGLQDVTGSAGGLAITVGKVTVRIMKGPLPHQMVTATSTTFADSKDFLCEVNLPIVVERADLEVMEKALDLDGQITAFGPTTVGRWKMRKQATPLLLKTLAGKNFLMLTVQKLQSTPAVATAKPAR
jgi:hypothetical protein